MFLLLQDVNILRFISASVWIAEILRRLRMQLIRLPQLNIYLAFRSSTQCRRKVYSWEGNKKQGGSFFTETVWHSSPLRTCGGQEIFNKRRRNLLKNRRAAKMPHWKRWGFKQLTLASNFLKKIACPNDWTEQKPSVSGQNLHIIII